MREPTFRRSQSLYETVRTIYFHHFAWSHKCILCKHNTTFELNLIYSIIYMAFPRQPLLFTETVPPHNAYETVEGNLSIVAVSVDCCDRPLLPSVWIVVIVHCYRQCWLLWLSVVAVSVDYCDCPLLPSVLIIVIVHFVASADCLDCQLMPSVLIFCVYCCRECWLFWLPNVAVSVDSCDCPLLWSVLNVVIVHCCRQCWLSWLSIVVVSANYCVCPLLSSVLIVLSIVAFSVDCVVYCCLQCWLF